MICVIPCYPQFSPITRHRCFFGRTSCSDVAADAPWVVVESRQAMVLLKPAGAGAGTPWGYGVVHANCPRIWKHDGHM